MVSNDSSIYTQPTLNLFFEKKSVFSVLGLKKASKFDLFKKNSTQNLHFPKNLSELNSTHPFNYSNIFVLGVPKVLYAGVNQHFWIFFS